MCPSDSDGYLIYNCRTDTQGKPAFGFPKEVCSWCCKEIVKFPFVSLISGRWYCCEACCVERESVSK